MPKLKQHQSLNEVSNKVGGPLALLGLVATGAVVLSNADRIYKIVKNHKTEKECCKQDCDCSLEESQEVIEH